MNKRVDISELDAWVVSLRASIKASQMSLAQISEATNVPRKTVHDFLHGSVPRITTLRALASFDWSKAA